MRGRENAGLRDLLAIRLAYDAALHRMGWREAEGTVEGAERKAVDELLDALARWQTAYEMGYRTAVGGGHGVDQA